MKVDFLKKTISYMLALICTVTLVFTGVFSVRADEPSTETATTVSEETKADQSEKTETPEDTKEEESGKSEENKEDSSGFETKTLKVLFIGNSYTRYNEMPQMFKRICDNSGIKVEVAMAAVDSSTLYDLVSLASVQKALKTGNYDFVIMQEQSNEILNVLNTKPVPEDNKDKDSGNKEEKSTEEPTAPEKETEKQEEETAAPEKETEKQEEETTVQENETEKSGEKPSSPSEDKKETSSLVAEQLKATDTVSVIKAAMKMAGDDVKFFLYETMSYNGQPQNQNKYTAAYEKAARETGAAVIPAGREFWTYADTYPNISMFVDDRHPTRRASEVIAKCIFDTLWKDLYAYTSLAIKTPELDLVATQIMPLDVRDVSEGNLSFVSNNPEVAEVDEKGLVTARAYGKAIITISNSVGASVFCNVNVSYRDVVKGVINDTVYDTVVWGTENGIVSGFNNGEYFGPEVSCTRGQFVVFLWRLAGRPESTVSCGFSDVNADMSIYDAICWAVEEGIIKGYDDGTFRPDVIVTRRHVAIMLWRWSGKPETEETESVFADMDPSDTSFRAVLWGEENGIMKGTDGYFLPDEDCQRCHVIIFLYRYARNYL